MFVIFSDEVAIVSINALGWCIFFQRRRWIHVMYDALCFERKTKCIIVFINLTAERDMYVQRMKNTFDS